MKILEKIIEARQRNSVEISKQQYGFMPGKRARYHRRYHGQLQSYRYYRKHGFSLRMLMEKYREGQRELRCVFMDLDKAYDWVPREQLQYCMRKTGMAEKIRATWTLNRIRTKEAQVAVHGPFVFFDKNWFIIF